MIYFTIIADVAKSEIVYREYRQVDASASEGNLNSISEVKISYLYQTIGIDIYKQSIALFLAEVLAYALKEEEQNQVQFSFIESSLQWLDQNDTFANFHLVFMLQLTKYLGFYPDAENDGAAYFDLEEGTFKSSKPYRNFLSGKKLILFKSIIGIKFDDMVGLKWNSEARQIVLDILLEYYELHLPGFKKPRSLKVLKEVFNEIS